MSGFSKSGLSNNVFRAQPGLESGCEVAKVRVLSKIVKFSMLNSDLIIWGGIYREFDNMLNVL